MKSALFVFLAVCTLAAAMVPRDRRALNTEDHVMLTNKTERPLCQPQTPCAWTIYKRSTKIIDTKIYNSFCECSPDTTCQIEDDGPSSMPDEAQVSWCRTETEKKDKTSES